MEGWRCEGDCLLFSQRVLEPTWLVGRSLGEKWEELDYHPSHCKKKHTSYTHSIAATHTHTLSYCSNVT